MTEAEELEELFRDWFLDLIMTQNTCLLRDVIRDSKDALKKAFMARRPVYTSQELEHAKAEGKNWPKHSGTIKHSG